MKVSNSYFGKIGFKSSVDSYLWESAIGQEYAIVLFIYMINTIINQCILIILFYMKNTFKLN